MIIIRFITVEGLILTGFVFECTHEGAFIAAISYVSDFALDFESAYRSSLAGSELKMVLVYRKHSKP